ncbi:biopolymer transporter ExbD [Robiginitalea sp. M366]|uniref:ExbD/TolR family protein n=1 Tax=Robiginitalea aestuariiviva TaxID=3036903 RepID=UPI00240E3456|nr:biopolymer transporter ExbD [Robiginitalea aestuariiviva]MDG1571057.1 biopolymer transporter ExbD [Robiginitalea aestuariiviva]
MPNRSIPEVSAGSMADIAFLLLIFFLVTTTIETDAGLDRMLPPDETQQPIVDIRQKNLFQVALNREGQLLVEEQPMDLAELRPAAIAFLDNGGDGSCAYCQGLQEASSSDNPNKAVITLKSDRETPYGAYIAVQNELTGAYNALRNREARARYGRAYTEIESEYLNPQTPPALKAILREQVAGIRELYPMKLTEAETARH